MYKISVIQFFSAAHFLRNYKGKCESLHGHNWKVEAVATGKELDSAGMVMDFGELKKITAKVLDELDHCNLNDLDYFSAKGGPASGGKERSPSSEEIARYIYIKLKEEISAKGIRLEEIKVWETDTSCASYSE